MGRNRQQQQITPCRLYCLSYFKPRSYCTLAKSVSEIKRMFETALNAEEVVTYGYQVPEFIGQQPRTDFIVNLNDEDRRIYNQTYIFAITSECALIGIGATEYLYYKEGTLQIVDQFNEGTKRSWTHDGCSKTNPGIREFALQISMMAPLGNEVDLYADQDKTQIWVHIPTDRVNPELNSLVLDIVQKAAGSVGSQ